MMLTKLRLLGPFVAGLSLTALTFALLCCSSEAEDEGVSWLIEGPGIQVGASAVLIGDDYSDLVDILGQPTSTRDLGELGVSFSYTDRFVSGIWVQQGESRTIRALFIHPGFTGQSPSGLGVGSSRATVVGEMGEARIDPFLGSWWYPERGVGFEWAGDRVERVILGVPSR